MYTVVPNGTTTCPNPCWAASMGVQLPPSFITLFIAEQLKILLECELVQYEIETYALMYTVSVCVCVRA